MHKRGAHRNPHTREKHLMRECANDEPTKTETSSKLLQLQHTQQKHAVQAYKHTKNHAKPHYEHTHTCICTHVHARITLHIYIHTQTNTNTPAKHA